MKEMRSLDGLIEHMRAKGIKFDIISEEEAKEFLSSRNYYFKLSSYRANYPKCPPEAGRGRAGQYQNLDFAYLKELSSIDRRLRYYVMEMCLDIEHAIKVRLVDSVAKDGEDGDEDGYSIVMEYLKDPNKFASGRAGVPKADGLKVLRSINYHKSGEYCRNLYNKYYPYFPVWVFVELISFGDLLRFARFYDQRGQSKGRETDGGVSRSTIIEPSTGIRSPVLIDGKLLNTIRDLRNASAHSNCLINKATERMDPTKQPHKTITTFVRDLGISKDPRRKYLNIKFTYNMAVLLYAYDYYASDEAKGRRYQELKEFVDGRVAAHSEYFNSNPGLQGVYKFMKKVIDSLVAKG